MNKIKNKNKNELYEDHFKEINKDNNKLDPKEPELEFGIKGYKKIKIDIDNKKHILKNPFIIYEEGNDYAYLPIKDQDQTAKAYRQMGYYFNYDQWNDKMNE